MKISDAGIYSCRVENAHGSLDADFRVSVDGHSYADSANSEEEINMHSGTFGSSPVHEGISPPPEPIIDQPYNNTTVRVGHTAVYFSNNVYECKVTF